MRRFFLVVGAFIIATMSSCTLFIGLGYADSVDDPSGENTGDSGTDDPSNPSDPSNPTDPSNPSEPSNPGDDGNGEGDDGDLEGGEGDPSNPGDNEDAEYEATATAAKAILDAYQATVADDELNNKNTNADKKAEVLEAFSKLKPADQEPYQTLIDRINRGGTPTLEYVGATEFEKAEGINYYSLIKATDNEDGEMTLNDANTTYSLTEQTPEEIADGSTTHWVSFRVTDSDGNTAELKQAITIKPATPGGDDQNPDDKDPDDKDPDDGNNPDQPGDKDPDDKPGDDQPDTDKPGTDQPGDDQNPDDKDPDNKPDDKPGDDDSDKPSVPGATDTDKDSGSNGDKNDAKLSVKLPNTGPTDILANIPAHILWSVVIGLFAAITTFCLTRKIRTDDLVALKK